MIQNILIFQIPQWAPKFFVHRQLSTLKILKMKVHHLRWLLRLVIYQLHVFPFSFSRSVCRIKEEFLIQYSEFSKIQNPENWNFPRTGTEKEVGKARKNMGRFRLKTCFFFFFYFKVETP